MHHYIDRAEVLLKQVWKDSNIHIVQKQNYINNNKYCLIDIYLNPQQDKQETLYLDSYFYRTNIRKGNTLIETFNKTSKSKANIIWARKGIHKIINIKLQYLQSITRGSQLIKTEHKKSFQILFKNVLKNFNNGKRVQLLKTQKINGLNAQISYFNDLNSWIISSDNVSLLAQSLNDLQNYYGERYLRVKQIAKQWFQEIKHLNQQQINKLKKQLDGYTLIGQLCGNSYYSHKFMIRYEQNRIIWFSLIDNFSDDYCIDPYEIKNKFQQFGFKFIKIKRAGSFNNKKLFFKALQQLFYKTAQATLEDKQYGMQGSILYFISPEMKHNQPHIQVLGSGQIKNIEYQFFYNVQSKISLLLNSKKSQKQIIIEFKEQCQQIQIYNKKKAPYPLNYYIKVLKFACELVKITNIRQFYQKFKYFTILKLIFYMITKTIPVNKYAQKLLKNEKFIEQVSRIPLQLYGPLNCSQKIIFIPINLPLISKDNLGDKIEANLNKLNLRYKSIGYQQQNQDQKAQQNINKIFSLINKQTSTDDEDEQLLMHFYLDMSLQCSQILQLNNIINSNGCSSIYYKIFLITDYYSQQLHYSQHQNKYPFQIQTIILSYYLVYKKYYSTPTIQQKIRQLEKVTAQLKKRRNFNDSILIKKLKGKYQMPYTKNVIISQDNKEQISKFISEILQGQRQYQNYCRLILKLQKLYKNTQNKLMHLSQEQIQYQVKGLIKNSFPEIPSIQSI